VNALSRALLVSFWCSALGACASTSSSRADGAPDEAGSATEAPRAAHVAPTTDAVARARGELALLTRDLSVLDERLAPALSAVNFTIMRNPACLDPLFEKYARLDLDRRAISLEEQDLRRTLDAIVAGEESGTLLLRVENNARKLRDRIATMNKDLALLFANAMSQRPTCDT